MNVSLRRILLPTDFSPPSKKARDYAAAIAGPIEAELHVLHVAEPFPVTDAGSWVTVDEPLTARIVNEIEKHFAVFLKDAGIRESRIITVARVGNPVAEIMKYATEHNIDLIVLGTHGRTGLPHALIGSVAEKIVRLANCPVLTVHPEGHQFLNR